MDEYKYMCLPQWILPQDFIDEHQIEKLCINNKIPVGILKVLYGLAQAGRLAYIALIKNLQLHGYTFTGFTPGLFKQSTQDTIFF